jgi:hypothetical protein
MHYCVSKAKFKRFGDVMFSNPFLVLCLLCNPVFGSATRFEKDSSSVGEVLLRVFGGPFSATNVSSMCLEHSEMFLQALSNFTPWAINSKFLFFCFSAYEQNNFKASEPEM